VDVPTTSFTEAGEQIDRRVASQQIQPASRARSARV
jgi:hypothetical protein